MCEIVSGEVAPDTLIEKALADDPGHPPALRHIAGHV